MNELQKLREIINSIDKDMAVLFEKRMGAVEAVAKYKKANGLPVEDLEREEKIIKDNSSSIMNEDYKSYYVNFLKGTIAVSKDLQHKILENID